MLDNAEHLVEGLGVLSPLLESAPELAILVTSRVRLNLRGEWIYEVSGLDVPASESIDSFEGYGSIELLADRLRQVRPKTPLLHEERPTVVRICRLVEGMPLAIELAAAWAQTLTIEQIADEIRKNLDFLSASLRDIPARHRSMRAVFNQTCQMLAEDEQAAYRRLSVSHDGFRPEAAERVADSSALQLSALINKSLLGQSPDGRYRVHGLLRQFGDELLSQDKHGYDRLRLRQSDYYLERLAAHEPALIGRDQRIALDEVDSVNCLPRTISDGRERAIAIELGYRAPLVKVRSFRSLCSRCARRTYSTLVRGVVSRSHLRRYAVGIKGASMNWSNQHQGSRGPTEGSLRPSTQTHEQAPVNDRGLFSSSFRAR